MQKIYLQVGILKFRHGLFWVAALVLKPAVRGWLSHCDASRKAEISIPDGFFEILR